LSPNLGIFSFLTSELDVLDVMSSLF